MVTTSTPDSVPSLAEVSRASSDVDGISRNLFQTPEPRADRNMYSLEYNESQIFGSGITIASDANNCSSTPSAVLKKSPFVESQLFPTPLKKDVCKHNDNGMYTYCHGGLPMSTKDLTGIFNIFADKQESGMNEKPSPGLISTADAETEVTCNLDYSAYSSVNLERKIESLEHECATLKEIIKTDSATILQLKAEVARRETPVQDQSSTSMISALPGFSALKQERDVLFDRELKHVEMIAKLKQEISSLKEMQECASQTLIFELEKCRLQNELLASQIVENEVETRGLKLWALNLENENKILRQAFSDHDEKTPGKGESLSGRGLENTHIFRGNNDEEPREEEKGPEFTTNGSDGMEALEAQIEFLAAKIEKIENDSHRREKEIEMEQKKTHNDLASIKAIFLPTETIDHRQDGLERICVTEAIDEVEVQSNLSDYEGQSELGDLGVEVTIDGNIIAGSSIIHQITRKQTHIDKVQDNKTYCDFFCNCFRSKSFAVATQ
jgi:hypothetical protein